jgi:predicted O-methyltransferase YrrM
VDPLAHAVALACKGFLDDDEGRRLYDLGREYAPLGMIVEVGSYCGKSTVYLGSGVKAGGGLLLCVDHHRGSEEHQVGEEYHDPDLFDARVGRLDSLPELRRTLHAAALEETAMPIVAPSPVAARIVAGPLGMVFIDGGHSHPAAHADYEAWSGKIVTGGVLAIHDLFPDPNEGGQAPIEIYRRGLASGLFDELPGTKTLGVLRRR